MMGNHLGGSQDTRVPYIFLSPSDLLTISYSVQTLEEIIGAGNRSSTPTPLWAHSAFFFSPLHPFPHIPCKAAVTVCTVCPQGLRS